MKKLILIVFISFVAVHFAMDAQVKRVLLEQHTGSWCGWCVDGTVKMDSILELYPDQVIGVKVHNGDSMTIAEQSILGSGLSITSFPSGTVDRKKFGTAIAQGRTLWKQDCITQMALTPKVDVNISYNINEDTRQLMAKVYATMVSTEARPLRFNVLIMEDSLTGTGEGWDQHNYLTGQSGYENNPYYNLPSVITGYQHMKVARKYLGGAWGVQGSFTNPANQGEVFTHDFSFEIPEGWKIPHLKIVGMVMVENTSDKEVLNCAYGIEGEAIIQMTSTDPNTGVSNIGVPLVKKFQLKNLANAEKTFVVSFTKSSRTPADWVADVDGFKDNELILAAGETKEVSLLITPGQTLGIGDASMEISVKDEPNTFKGTGTLSCASKEIQHIEIVSAGERQYSLSDTLINLGYEDFVRFSSTEFIDFGNQLTPTTLVFNSGSAERFSEADVSNILNAVSNKIPVFVCGNQAMSGLYGYGALPPFGMEYYGYSTQGYGSSPWRVWLSGVDGDFISGFIGPSLEGNLIRYLITLNKITNTNTTKPIMHFQNAGKRIMYNSSTNKNDTLDVTGDEAVFGVRYENNNQRTVFLNITPFVIVNKQIRNELIDKIMKWIRYELNDVDEELPQRFSLSPNPANDVIYFNIPEMQASRLRVYDAIGNIIDDIVLDKDKSSFQYNVSHLSSGVYSAEIYSIGNVIRKLFVVSK